MRRHVDFARVVKDRGLRDEDTRLRSIDHGALTESFWHGCNGHKTRRDPDLGSKPSNMS